MPTGIPNPRDRSLLRSRARPASTEDTAIISGPPRPVLHGSREVQFLQYGEVPNDGQTSIA